MVPTRVFPALSALVLVGLLSQLAVAKKTEVLDQDEATLDIERVAQLVCDVTRGADKQISRFSTIQSLIDFFKSISHDHKLAGCADKYLPAIEHMQLILSSGNEDVCSDTKISLIESFHRSFVSKARKYRKEQKANQLVAPKLLKLFYMHYTSAVSSTCARSAVRELQAVEFDEDAKREQQSGKSLMDQLSSTLGRLDASNGYKDMFLVWNFVDSLPVEQDSKLSRYLHEGKTRLYLQVQKAEGLKGIQDACRHKLRPFYSLSLLPVIRLADLGFYPEDETLAQMLSEKSNYHDLYSLVQLCEALLPLHPVENASLNAGQLIVLPKEQVPSIETNEFAEEPVIGYNPTNKVEALDTVAHDVSQVFITRVKGNVNSRVRVQNKILRRMILKYKRESSSGEIVLSDGHSGTNDLSALVEQQLSSTDESASLSALEEGDEDDEEKKSDAVVRKKRGVISILRHTLAFVVTYLLVIVYVVIWLTLWIFRLLIVLPLGILNSILLGITGDKGDALIAVDEGLYKVWFYKLPFFFNGLEHTIAGTKPEEPKVYYLVPRRDENTSK